MELLGRIDDVAALGQEVTWAVDLPDGGAAQLIGLLVTRGQALLYIPGRTVNRAAGSYRGEGRTDARDAAVIAGQARMVVGRTFSASARDISAARDRGA